MKFPIVLMGVICLALPACTPPQQAEPVSEEAPSTEADVEAIKASLEQLLAIQTAGDFDGWLSFYTEDVVAMPPNTEAVIGQEGAREWGQPFFDRFNLNETSSIDEVKVFGDWAFMRGVYNLQLVPKEEGETIEESGKFIYILERQTDDSWKFSRLIWNTNSPTT